MGQKNRELANQKRRQRAGEKAKSRKAMPKKTPPPVAKSLGSMNIAPELFTDDQQLWWIAHGVNCIVSDYDKGIWTPLFEGIYATDGSPIQIPAAEDIAQIIMDKYNVKDKEWPQEAKSALAWTVQDRQIVYVYYMEAMRRLTAAHGGDAEIEAMSRQPHNPIVWALFSYLKEKILKRK